MKIIIISQYFWPETFRINDLALGFKERGHEVTVLTGKPNYPGGKFFEGYSLFNRSKETWNGIKIYRVPLMPRGSGKGLQLALNYISFAFFSSLKALFLKKRFDLIFVFEPSPITVGIPAIFLSKRLGIPVFFWVQDLWPESVSVAGQITNKYILRKINSLTKWVYNNSKRILIQSKGFEKYILKQGIPPEKIIYYPNSAESLYRPVVPRDEIRSVIPDVPFKVMFAGNIGEAQDFDTILQAAKLVKEKNINIHFIILGDGRKRGYVEERKEKMNLSSNFHMLGSYPVEDMPCFFACSDVLLVTLKKSEIFALTIPSKIQSYLACSKPIIAALDGEGANVIKEAKAGLVSESGNANKLAKNILAMYNFESAKRQEMSDNARLYYQTNFEREMLLDKLIFTFNTI